MSSTLLKTACFAIFLSACVSSSRNSKTKKTAEDESIITASVQPDIPVDRKPDSLTNLPRTEEGAFVLAPGFYEAEFKTYCLQPGTPDPRPRDAYLQMPMSGYRKEIVQSVLVNSRSKPDIDQRNVQLLLWSVVSGSDFNKLSTRVQSDAMRLLTAKQVFELKGGVMGVVKTVANHLPSGITNGHNDIYRLFEMGASSYEAYEKIAVLREASKIKRTDFKNDQWYQQKQNYFVRYFPVSYKKVKIQVYVPDNVLDSSGKVSGEYLVFDPTGLQAIPANSNAQRLGVGALVIDIVRQVIKINKQLEPPKRLPEPKKDQKTSSKTS